MPVDRVGARWHDYAMGSERDGSVRGFLRRIRRNNTLLPSPNVVGLRDIEVADRLARTGYARLGGYLSVEEVAAARSVFVESVKRLGRPIGERWFPTIMLPEGEVRDFISDELEAIIAPNLSNVVDSAEIELLRLHFSVKPPSVASELGPHQDFSVVDERKASSLYLWIALEDMNEVNGALHVVPGSHRFSNEVRSQHVPSTFDEVLDRVHESAVRLDCRAGELILMVSGVIHFSPPNNSSDVRLAAHGILKPVGSPMVFYFADELTPPGKVECYELGMDDYVEQVRQGRPRQEVPLRELVDRPPDMTPERFERGLAATRDAWA